MTVAELYNCEETIAKDLLQTATYPWEILDQIGTFILTLGSVLDPLEYDKIAEDVWIAKDAEIASSAVITGPCIIGKRAEIRPNAYIRGKAIVGEDAVVGNSTELKNVILFNKVQVPHYNYVGDSVLGYKAHMGAGSITSNIKSDRTQVTISADGEKLETGLIKMGAMLGDYVEVGCNTVMNPGTVVGKHSNIYPTSMVRGYIPENSIYKGNNKIVKKTEKREEEQSE